MDCSTRSVALSSHLWQRCTVPVPSRSGCGPHRGKVLEFGESVLAHLPKVEKDVGILRTNERVYAREAYDDSPSTAGQKKTSSSCEPPQKPKSKTLNIPPAADTFAPPPAVPEVHEDETEKPKENGRRRDARKATRHNDDAWSFELHQKREAHRNTRSHFRGETVDDEVLSRKANSHGCRRECQTKTDGENRHEERRRAHANGDRGFVSAEHGEHTPQRRQQCGNESSE